MDSRPSPPSDEFSLGRPFIQSSITGPPPSACLVRRESPLHEPNEGGGGFAFSPSPTPSSMCLESNRAPHGTLVLSTRDDAHGGNTGLNGASESVSPVPFNVSEGPVQWNNGISSSPCSSPSGVLFGAQLLGHDDGVTSTTGMRPFPRPRIRLWVPACVPNLPALVCVPQTATQLPELSSHDPCRLLLTAGRCWQARSTISERLAFRDPVVSLF
jgi:hypothetical protein